MSSFAIEKNVAMPSRSERVPKYPFAQMEVGDSFFVPCKPDEPVQRVRNRMLGACMWAKRKLGEQHRFVVRVDESDPSTNGVRVWRVE